MKKPIIFDTDSNSIIFKDSNDETSFYCMSEEVRLEEIKITNQYDRDNSKVPDEFVIKVYPLIKVESKDNNTDTYKPSTNLVDFPINRIKWVFVRKTTRS